MAIQQLTYPTSEPVFLSDVREYLRIDQSDTSNDSTLSIMLTAARQWTETYCRRRWMPQTLRLNKDFFPGTYDQRFRTELDTAAVASGASALFAGVRFAFILPYSPVKGAITIRYISDQSANDGTLTYSVVDPNLYMADIASEPARVAPKWGTFWPTAAVITNAIQVDYPVGYGRLLTVGTTVASTTLTGTGFTVADIGSTISIAGAGLNGSSLNCLVAAVDPTTFVATLSTPAPVAATTTAAIVGVPSQARLAIIALTALYFENRLGMAPTVPDFIKAILFPCRDLRF